MDTQKVELFLSTRAKYFEADQSGSIREILLELNDSQMSGIIMLPFKDPGTMQIVSIFGGVFGIDRFMLGDMISGIIKLFTAGGFWIWAIVDWFTIKRLTRKKNLQLVQDYVSRTGQALKNPDPVPVMPGATGINQKEQVISNPTAVTRGAAKIEAVSKPSIENAKKPTPNISSGIQQPADNGQPTHQNLSGKDSYHASDDKPSKQTTQPTKPEGSMPSAEKVDPPPVSRKSATAGVPKASPSKVVVSRQNKSVAPFQITINTDEFTGSRKVSTSLFGVREFETFYNMGSIGSSMSTYERIKEAISLSQVMDDSGQSEMHLTVVSAMSELGVYPIWQETLPMIIDDERVALETTLSTMTASKFEARREIKAYHLTKEILERICSAKNVRFSIRAEKHKVEGHFSDAQRSVFKAFAEACFGDVVAAFKMVKEINRIHSGSETYTVQGLDADEFEAERELCTCAVLDARNYEDYKSGFIENAIYIELDKNTYSYVLDKGYSLASFYKDSEYLLVTSPGMEKIVIQKLIEQGYTNVAGYLKGGFDAWRSADKPFSRMA